MKKLLSLLSILTISGTAVPTTIAASPYQKEETIKNSDINYSQTNNLENLSRNKRNINQINNLINEIKNIKFNGIKKIVYNGPDKNNLPNKPFFAWENRIYFIFNADGGIYYEFDQNTKNTIRTKTNHNVYSHLEGMGNTLKNINNEYPILNNKKYIIINGKVYEEDRTNHEQKIVLEDIYTNPDGSTIGGSDFNINGIILNGKIYFICDNGKLYEYWPFESMLEQDESLINWKQLFNDWRNNMDFDFKNNFTSKSETEKQSWIYNKKHELLVKIDNLKDKINIIKNRENIEQLKIQFSSLEQKIDNLRIKIDNLLNNSSNSSNLLTTCSNLTSLMSAGTSVIPVVGSITSAAFGIISAGCSIANE